MDFDFAFAKEAAVISPKNESTPKLLWYKQHGEAYFLVKGLWNDRYEEYIAFHVEDSYLLEFLAGENDLWGTMWPSKEFYTVEIAGGSSRTERTKLEHLTNGEKPRTGIYAVDYLINF